jgi:hypothetical protein
MTYVEQAGSADFIFGSAVAWQAFGPLARSFLLLTDPGDLINTFQAGPARPAP